MADTTKHFEWKLKYSTPHPPKFILAWLYGYEAVISRINWTSANVLFYCLLFYISKGTQSYIMSELVQIHGASGSCVPQGLKNYFLVLFLFHIKCVIFCCSTWIKYFGKSYRILLFSLCNFIAAISLGLVIISFWSFLLKLLYWFWLGWS